MSLFVRRTKELNSQEKYDFVTCINVIMQMKYAFLVNKYISFYHPAYSIPTLKRIKLTLPPNYLLNICNEYRRKHQKPRDAAEMPLSSLKLLKYRH